MAGLPFFKSWEPESLSRVLRKLYWRLRLRGQRPPAGFDSRWYRQMYQDVASANLDPEIHYLRFGRHERRDPNPSFSASGYVRLEPSAAEAVDPLEHYLREGRKAGLLPLPEFEGLQPFRQEAPVLMVCGHQAGRELYGAERSLLDVLKSLNGLGVNLIVTLPSAVNEPYLKAIEALAWKLVILPYGWWRAGNPAIGATQKNFERLLVKYTVNAVLANTLVLHEPVLAARRLDIPVAIFVRELPAHDEALCQLLNTTPEAIANRVRELADVVVSNSSFTAKSLALPKAEVVPNVISIERFRGLATPTERGEPFTVVMISSNLPKKGLEDFVALAWRLQPTGIQCRLIGPENSHVAVLRQQQEAGEVPPNLLFAGYASKPEEALLQGDVVVNLSHFEESFGRTVLEAMAAARPVVAYRWGALPELVEHKVTGCLAPLGDVEAVANYVQKLAEHKALRRTFGRAGQEKARRCYSHKASAQGLRKVLRQLKSSRLEHHSPGTA
ncbi:glycosyltransferase family 4 protein [Marinimicrobium sp. ABcell2]|uniref:glycosyltransferase family 4 protein n=1 Tax=Marinimicrobium sp. ABcell2 TaxID=3069751 RepID=UPI0027B30A75|nr:glycosyltransferase family 4 protein [Marinimicrobium sp. ABcell2]MDQ2078335.1 glycosyltransferase family 4 protein [Marinimicrobium sp. ABcell2]